MYLCLILGLWAQCESEYDDDDDYYNRYRSYSYYYDDYYRNYRSNYRSTQCDLSVCINTSSVGWVGLGWVGLGWVW